jgi:hypothetical protein
MRTQSMVDHPLQVKEIANLSKVADFTQVDLSPFSVVLRRLRCINAG